MAAKAGLLASAETPQAELGPARLPRLPLAETEEIVIRVPNESDQD